MEREYRVAGLIASDGCLLNDNRHIDFTSKDHQLVELYRELIRPNVKIGIKKSGNGQSYFRVQFGDVALYDFLLDAGITQNKSKVIGALKIPDIFFADFLRGYFDGDGTVFGFWDIRWHNSFMHYTSYISASKPFLDWVQLNNVNLASTKAGKVGPAVRAFKLTYAKNDSRKLFDFMYYNLHVPKLTRKYDKFANFLKTDPYGRMGENGRVVK